MAANLKLASARDGNRAELAAAIEGVARAEAVVVAASAAEAKAEERIEQAYEKLRAAQADAASVEERQVAALVDEFSGAEPRAVMSLAQAQAAVAEAEHVLATAKKALGHIKLAAEEPQRGLAKARGRVDRAIGAVAGGEVGRILDDAYRAERAIVDLRVIIKYLMTIVAGPEKEQLYGFLKRPWLIHELGDAWERHEAIAPWRKAREALTQDPDAPLPIDFR